MILKNMVSGCHDNRSTVGLDDLKRSFLALMILRLKEISICMNSYFFTAMFSLKKKKVKTIPATLLTDVNLKNCKVLT